MNYFSMRQLFLFPSYTLPVKEQEKLDRFLSLLDESGVADLLNKVDENTSAHDAGGRPTQNKYAMLAMILYGFAFSTGSLRDLEDNCKYDLRFAYLMQNEHPDHSTICLYINKYIVPQADQIFVAVNKAILKTCGIVVEDAYVDGTKIEADANKYKFVWKPSKYHEKLCNKVRVLLTSHNLGRGIPEKGIFGSSLIAEKVSQFSLLVQQCNDQSEKRNLKKQYQQLIAYLTKALEYETKERICGPDRNSYYKTDHDATAMTLKSDYYSGLGSNMHAAYNAQIVISKGFAVAYYVSQSRSDIKDFIPVMEKYHEFYGSYPKNICADSGYGSLYNYRFLDQNKIGNYVKHQTWEGNISGRHPVCYRLNDDLTITCLNGNSGKPTIQPNRHPKKSGSVFYRIDGCAQCSFSTYCKRYQKVKDEDFKIFEVNIDLCRYRQQAEDNLLSVKGIEIRVNRSSQVEGSFGVLKQDMHYLRFRRISLQKVTAEYMLTFLGYNIRKLFRYYDGNLKTKYWIAPADLQPQKFKKPSAKRLANHINKKKSKSANESAKDSYKYAGSRKKDC